MRQKKQEASVVYAYKRESASIVEDAVLIGMPMFLLEAKEWITFCKLAGWRPVRESTVTTNQIGY